MNKSRVSIGIAVYNAGLYIERCAKSLFSQTYDTIEYIFVDDASQDDSIEVLRRLCNLFPSRNVTIVCLEANHGVSYARNIALSKMTGDFVLWVDSDDWVDVNLVKNLVQRQEETNADIVLFDAICHYKDNSTIWKRQPPRITSVKDYSLDIIKKKVPYELWGRFIRRSILTNNHIECLPGVNIGEDFQVTTRASYYSRIIAVESTALYHYNCSNPNALTKNGSIKQSWQTIDFVYEFFSSREIEYKQAAQYMVLWSISCDFISFAKYGNLSLFEEGRRRLDSIDRKDWNILPFSRRFILYFSSIPLLVRVLGRIASSVHSLMNRISFK